MLKMPKLEKNSKKSDNGAANAGADTVAIAKEAKPDSLSVAALFSQVGVSMSVCVLVGILGGVWVDRRFGTSPWFLFIGALIGTASSFKSLYDIAVKKRKKP